MPTWNAGKVVGRQQWNETLHTLYVEADVEPFDAGQFVKLGVEIDGKVVGRPYSFVNPPGTRPLEFYYIDIPNGLLTSNLTQLLPGDDIFIAPRASGFMILEEVPAAKHLWLMATGTGVGPFLSILMTEKPWQRFERVVLVYAVRTLSDLSYQERIAQIQLAHPGQFSFVPFLSREDSDFAMLGRIPPALRNGRMEAHVDLAISAANSHIMLCGNPQMVEDTSAALLERGLKKHRRSDPGQITTETYW